MQTQARPPSPQPVIAAKAATRNSSSRRPQKRSFRLPNAAKNPYLNSYANATSATTDSHEKDGPQLRPCPRPTAQIAPNCAKKPSLQLRHATKNSYLNSYANAANATTLSYEKTFLATIVAASLAGHGRKSAPKHSSPSYGMRPKIPI